MARYPARQKSKFVYDEKTYFPLIVKKSKEAWLRLPPQTRVWVSLEDFISEGVLFVRGRLLRRYNPRKSKFTTVLWISLENHFKFITQFYYAQKRFDGRNAPLQEIMLSCSTQPKHPFQIQAIDAIHKIFDSGSPALQDYMLRWLSPASKTSFHLRGDRFYNAVREFRLLSRRHRLGADEMRWLMHDHGWYRYAPLQPCVPVKLR